MFDPILTEEDLTAEEQRKLQDNNYTLDTHLSELDASKDGGAFFDVGIKALQRARTSGKLSGCTAPEYIKLGTRVYYTPRLAFNWRRANSRMYRHTGDAA